MFATIWRERCYYFNIFCIHLSPFFKNTLEFFNFMLETRVSNFLAHPNLINFCGINSCGINFCGFCPYPQKMVPQKCFKIRHPHKLIPQKPFIWKNTAKNTILHPEMSLKRRKYWQLCLKSQKIIPQNVSFSMTAKINSAKSFEILASNLKN